MEIFETVKCVICEREADIPEEVSERANTCLGNYRITIIGVVCQQCFPFYRKVSKVLIVKLEENLHTKLDKIHLIGFNP